MKTFPFLSEDKEYSLNDIFEYCQNLSAPKPAHIKTLNHRDILERNYSLMQLKNVDISGGIKSNILKSIRSEIIPPINKIEFLRLLNEDGVLQLVSKNPLEWVSDFSKLNLRATEFNNELKEEK
jgi:hypothetical protein